MRGKKGYLVTPSSENGKAGSGRGENRRTRPKVGHSEHTTEGGGPKNGAW